MSFCWTILSHQGHSGGVTAKDNHRYIALEKLFPGERGDVTNNSIPTQGHKIWQPEVGNLAVG